MTPWEPVEGTIVPGYRVASGLTDSSPYPQGTIAMQTSYFQALGLDLSPYYPGTLNISIHPKKFEVRSPQYTFRNVRWIDLYPAEDFSFSNCQIVVEDTVYEGWIYYPHPETKIGHFQNDSLLEVIAPSIPNLHYGDAIVVRVRVAEIAILCDVE